MVPRKLFHRGIFEKKTESENWMFSVMGSCLLILFCIGFGLEFMIWALLHSLDLMVA